LEYVKEARIFESEDHMDTNGAQEVSPPHIPKREIVSETTYLFSAVG